MRKWKTWLKKQSVTQQREVRDITAIQKGGEWKLDSNSEEMDQGAEEDHKRSVSWQRYAVTKKGKLCISGYKK